MFFPCSCESSCLYVGYFCEICDKKYKKNDGDSWIGCDGECNRWFHYKCVAVTDATVVIIHLSGCLTKPGCNKHMVQYLYLV